MLTNNKCTSTTFIFCECILSPEVSRQGSRCPKKLPCVSLPLKHLYIQNMPSCPGHIQDTVIVKAHAVYGRFCALIHKKIWPTGSGSDKTMGLCSVQCKDGVEFTVFSFKNPMNNCVLFLTIKHLFCFPQFP